MDHQISNIIKKLSGTNITTIDLAEGQSIGAVLQALKRGVDPNALSDVPVPVIQCRYPPSVTQVAGLKHVTLKNLELGVRHGGKVIYLAVNKTTRAGGTVLHVKDSNGEEGKVYSLIFHPCGGYRDLCEGAIIAVKEPYYGIGSGPDAVICVVHPSDIAYVSKYDERARLFFPGLAVGDDAEHMRLGDVALISEDLLGAVDHYSAGLDHMFRIEKDNVDLRLKIQLKQAFALSKLHAYARVLEGSQRLLHMVPGDSQAQRLAFTAAYEMQQFEQARAFAPPMEDLKGLGALDTSKHRLLQQRLNESVGSYDFEDMVQQVSGQVTINEAASFTHHVRISPSVLGGRGIMAKKVFIAGDIVLCEKPFAIAYRKDRSAHQQKLTGLEDGNETGGRRLALLQKIAQKVWAEPMQGKELFNFYAPEKDEDRSAGQIVDGRPVCDSTLALSIVKHNAFVIFPGKASDLHEHLDPLVPKGNASKLSVADQACGLWKAASYANHSCLPNATWSWVGDLLVLRATRPIEDGEKVTISYLQSSANPKSRRQRLNDEYGFTCSCALCVADASASTEDIALREEMVKRTKTIKGTVRLISRDFSSKEQTDLQTVVKTLFKSYDTTAYKGLPKLALAKPLMLMAQSHLYQATENAISDQAALGRVINCLLDALEVGLGIKLLQHLSSSYCELQLGPSSHVSSLAVESLIMLAEIHHMFNTCGLLGKQRSGPLKFCAKQVYRILYGEDSTFDGKFAHLKCTEVPALPGDVPEGTEWALLKEEVVGSIE